MRSLYIYTHGFPDPNGHSTAARLSWLHLTLLAARGPVDLIALLPLREAAAKPPPALAALCRTILPLPAPGSALAGILSALAGACRGIPPAPALKLNAACAAALEKSLASQSHDLIAFHSTDGLVNLPARLPPRGKRPALILFSEEIQWTAWRSYSPGQWRAIGPQQALQALLWRRMRAFERTRYRRLDGVFCLSQREEHAVAGLDPAIPTRLLPLPLEAGLLTPPTTTTEKPVILFTGFFGHPPNRLAAHELAHDLFPRVRRTLPGATLRLAGRGASTLAGCSGPGIERIDSLPSLAPEYAAAAVLAGPLRTGEGVRGKFLESLASACPVVTTPLGASGIRAGEEEGLLIRETRQGLADAILQLLPNPALRRRLGLAGRNAVLRHHSADAFGEAFNAGLATILHPDGNRP
jgi:glycosyltransferase involved in cell wall biosynthesis